MASEDVGSPYSPVPGGFTIPKGLTLQKEEKPSLEGVEPPYYLEDRGFKVLESWKNTLFEQKIDAVFRIGRCNPENRWVFWKCPDGHFQTWRPFQPCNDPFCLMCAGRYGRRKGVEMFHVLRAYGMDVGHFVFTIPEQFRKMFFDRKMLNRLKALCRRVLSEFYGGMIGGVQRPHTWGDREPEWIGEKHLHVHNLIPLVMFDLKKDRFQKVQKFLTRVELLRLRMLYKSALEKTFNISFDGEVDLHYSYKPFDEPEKLMNVCMYVMRPPLEVPLRDRMKKVMLFGRRRFLRILEHFQLYRGWRSVSWFGLCSARSRTLALAILNKCDLEDVERSLADFDYKVCPVCGKRLVVVAIFKDNKLIMITDRGPPEFAVIPSRESSVARVSHDFESLKAANPLMPDWMIRKSMEMFEVG